MNDQEVLQEILEHTKLSANELRSFFKKFNDFINSLSEGERQMFLCSLKTLHTAAAELGDAEISAENLEKALRSEVPEGFLCFCCTFILRRPKPPKPVPSKE